MGSEETDLGIPFLSDVNIVSPHALLNRLYIICHTATGSMKWRRNVSMKSGMECASFTPPIVLSVSNRWFDQYKRQAS